MCKIHKAAQQKISQKMVDIRGQRIKTRKDMKFTFQLADNMLEAKYEYTCICKDLGTEIQANKITRIVVW